jgi:purine-nucleoside phosphorylase
MPENHTLNDWPQIQPEWGIVLGSGLGSFVELLEVLAELPYAAIDGLPQSKVAGHAGRFLLGRLGATTVLVAAGRVHLYEGWSAREVTAHVRWLHARGVRRLLLTNAAGTTNPAFAPGQWMLLSDHLNLTGTTPLLGGANFVDMSEVYSARLRARFRAAAQSLGVPLHEGVYAALLGPQYETPAEIRMLQRLGADAVGMSTALEAIQARALGLEVAAFSCLTNWAAGLSPQQLAHEEVITTGQAAAGQLVQILERAMRAEAA